MLFAPCCADDAVLSTTAVVSAPIECCNVTSFRSCACTTAPCSCFRLKEINITACDCITDRGMLSITTCGAGVIAAQQHTDQNDDIVIGMSWREAAEAYFSTSLLMPQVLSRMADAAAAASFGVTNTAALHKPPPPPPVCLLEKVVLDGVFHVGDLTMGYLAARARRLRSLSLRGYVPVRLHNCLQAAVLRD